MAYGKKYTITFRDLKQLLWKAHIFKKDYVSTTYDLKCGADPLTFEIRASGDAFDPVKIQEAVLSVVVDGTMMGGDTDENRLNEFKTANIFDFYIQIEKETAVASGVYADYYYGTFVTDIYTEPFKEKPYEISLRFTDLGDLEFVEFKETDILYHKTTNYIGYFIAQALKNLPYSFDLRDMVNVFPDAIVEVNSDASSKKVYINPLNYIEFDKNAKAAKAKSCLEFLRQISLALGSRFFQWDSKWWLVYISQMTDDLDGSFRYNDLSKADNFSTNIATGTLSFGLAIPNTEADGQLKSEGAELSIEGIVDRLIYKYRNQEPLRNANNIIFNYEFDKGFYDEVDSNRIPNFWKPHSSLLNGNKNIVAAQLNSNDFIIYTGLEGEINSFSFTDLAIIAARTAAQGGDAGRMFTSTDKYYISAFNPATDGNTYLAQESVSGVGADTLRINIKGMYVWHKFQDTTFPHNVVLQPILVRVKEAATGTNYYWASGNWITGETTTIINYQLLLTGNFWTTPYHENRFNISVELGFPFTGEASEIEVRTYVPMTLNYKNDTGNNKFDKLGFAVYDSVSVSYLTNDQSADEVVIVDNELDITPRKENEKTIEVMQGDGLFPYSLGTFFTKLTTVPAITSTWHYRGVSEDISAANKFIIDPFFSIYSDFVRKISGEVFVDNLPLYNKLLINDGFYYLIDSLIHSVKNSSFKLNLIELTERAFIIIDPPRPTGITEITSIGSIPIRTRRPTKPTLGGSVTGGATLSPVTASVVGKKSISTFTDSAGNYPE